MTESEVNSIDKQGNTALHSAVKAKNAGYLQVISALLEAGIDINLRNNQGDTTLHLAVRKSDYEVAQKLLTAGADANITNGQGNTPLHIATQKGDHQMVDALLKGGADAKFTNKRGKTSLHLATERGYIGVVTLLQGAALFVKPNQVVNVLENITSIMQQRLTTAAIKFDFFSKDTIVPGNNNVQTDLKDRPSLAK